MPLTIQEVADALPSVRNIRISGNSQFAHSAVIPYATYSPWIDDPEFCKASETVRRNTLVDLYRLFELWSLVGQIAKLDGDILEVGVWRGGTGCLMAARAKALGSRAKIFLCDTFAGVVKAGEADSRYKGGEHADTSADIVENLAVAMKLDNVRVLKGIFPDDTGHLIDGLRFSLCHIDVDVYESAGQIFDWVWPRLQPGGIVVFDDYGFSTCDGVTRLVNERAHTQGALMLHNLNGHAIFIKVSG